MQASHNKTTDKKHGLCAASIFFFASYLLFFVFGCVSIPKTDPTKPVEHIFFVQADEVWQNSGVYAKRNQLIQCEAKGVWGDADGKYGPEGNRNFYKNHLGVNAPTFGLLMQISTETNKAYFVGSEANIRAARSGYVTFRNNVSLFHRASGDMKVKFKVASDADGDGVSDYDEINIWGTDPLNPDTNGHGFGDLEKVNRMKKALELEKDEE